MDVPHTLYVYEHRWLWAFVNWTAVAWPLLSGFRPRSAGYLAALLFQGVVLFGAYVAATVPYRDRYMADWIGEHADDYADGRLVTGSGHHEGVARHLGDYENVTVLNPRHAAGGSDSAVERA